MVGKWALAVLGVVSGFCFTAGHYYYMATDNPVWAALYSPAALFVILMFIRTFRG